MIKGLLVIQQGGIPVYSFMQEKTTDEQELFISSFVTAIQSFAKMVMSREEDGVLRVVMPHAVFVFRILTLHNEKQKDVQYCFALLADSEKKGEDLPEMLEYLMVCFLAHESGRFNKELRKTSQDLVVYKAFDEFMKGFLRSDWKTVRKKVRPAPASILQGILNELRNYMPIEQIVTLHPKIQRLGPSYAWLSDDIPAGEEENLMKKIGQELGQTYGKGVYDSLVDGIRKRLSTSSSPRD